MVVSLGITCKMRTSGCGDDYACPIISLNKDDDENDDNSGNDDDDDYKNNNIKLYDFEQCAQQRSSIVQFSFSSSAARS